MVLIEAAVGLTLILAVAITVAFGGKAISVFFRGFTLQGKIETKRKALANQAAYIRELSQKGYTAKYRRDIAINYQALAQKKKEQIALELEALEIEKERRQFEEHMKGSA